MKIELKELNIENFKGVKKFSMKPAGQNCLVLGENGSGKTTLMDAFLWVLFDKDSRGNSQFSVKPLAKTGDALHNLESFVDLILIVDGKDLSLQKIYKEKYTKKRGSRKAEFTGHTTDYYINDVPTQKKEWDKRIAEIIDEETFKLLTSSTYFNSLHWERRRSILLDVCGNLTEEDVIASDSDLDALTEILGEKSVKDQKKIIASQKKLINDRLKEIPARIDELGKSLADVSEIDVKACEKRIETIDKEIEAMRDDSILSKMRKEKAELEAELAEKRTKRNKKYAEATFEQRQLIEDLRRSGREKVESKTKLALEIGEKNEIVALNERTMTDLRNGYNELMVQEPDVKDTCYACGQSLPAEDVEAARDKYNANKAKNLAEINEQGKGLKAKNEKLIKEIELASDALAKLEEEIAAMEKELTELEKNVPGTPEDTVAMKRLIEDIGRVQENINGYDKPDTSKLEGDRRDQLALISDAEHSKKTGARIEELKQEEKKLAAEYEALEQQTFLIEKYIVKEVELLEETINNRFEIARFKLFKEQINEGIVPTCVTLYNGVPYGDALNTGAEINVGIDIIRTLAQFYGIQAPVWIDHAESVTELLDPGSQTLKLMVSPDHQELEVSYE